MIILEKFSMIMLFTLLIGNAFSTFTIENDTGLSHYRSYTTKGTEVQNFRLRVTFDETGKDLEWLNNNHQQVNKAYVPKYQGITSEPVKIAFPEFEYSHTQYITLYLTASAYGEDNPNQFLSATTFKLDEPQWIKNIHIIFGGLNKDNSPDVKLNVTNDSKLIQKIKMTNFTLYLLTQR